MLNEDSANTVRVYSENTERKPEIQINMLGKFDIFVDGESILPHIGNSSKGVTLLKYLILNRNKRVSVSDLIDMFWYESDKSANPESALKTMVSRMRANMAKAHPYFKNCIIAENKSYSWNEEIDCEVDALIFEELCVRIFQVNELSDEVREGYLKLLGMYGGDLSDIGSGEGWIIMKSIYLHHLYVKAVYRLIEMLREDEDYETIIQVCRIALDIDAFDETLNFELMRALKDGGQINAALYQYKYITSVYCKHMGVEPSEKILGLYRDIMKPNMSEEASLNEIKKSLEAAAEEKGAFVCDYSIFKDIYLLQVRNLKRQYKQMFLSMVTVNRIAGEPFDPLVLEDIMRELLEVVKKCLRKGDTISRYSPSQYAILLPMVTYSDGNTALNRIKKMFYKKYSNNGIKISFQFGFIEQ